MRKAMRLLLPLLVGRRGALLFLVASGGWLAQAVVEWVIAALLIVFLHATGLLGDAALPEWLPAHAATQGSLGVWALLLVLAACQSALQVMSFQARILLSERAHTRLRMLLAFRAFRLETPPPPLSRMTYLSAEVFPRTAAALLQVVQVSCLAAQALALGAAMCFVAPAAAAVALAGLGTFGALVWRFNLINSRASERLLQAQDAYERSKVRLSRNWLLIRALRLDRHEYRAQIEACAGYYRHRAVGYFFGNLGTALGPLMAVLMLAAVVVVHDLWLGGSAAALLAFLYLLFRFQQMLSGASHIAGDVFAYGPHVREAAAFAAEFTEAQRREALLPDRALSSIGRARLGETLAAADPTGPPEQAAAPSIEVRDLCFGWPGERPLLENLCVELRAGGQLAVTGPNGAGKSSFLAVVLGILPSTAGSARLAGLESGVWVARHRSAIGFVGPESYLMHGSLLENLCYGLERSPTEPELWSALERSGLAERIRSLPARLEHPIEEGGEGLSTGERQKLAIARALLRRPRLLILDEPTAHVDAESERDIAGTLHGLQGECTLVLVSHKPGLVRHADRVLELALPARQQPAELELAGVSAP